MSIAILHYLPLEFYPPATNLLTLLADRKMPVVVFTCHNNKDRSVFSAQGIKIVRYPLPDREHALIRFCKYFLYNIAVLVRLIRLKPRKILYYETHSAYPVYLYKKYVNRKVDVYIHCHEYLDPGWYKTYARLLQYYHKKETSFLYRKAKWISHTNRERVQLFLNDHPYIPRAVLRVLPNYPPVSWTRKAPKAHPTGPVRCVYIGALSLESTYIRECCEWVNRQNGKITLDIYSFNVDKTAEEYLTGMKGGLVRFFNSGIEYGDIPVTLEQYDVGLLLYKATTLNFRFNAPNKLFEYLSCGLDVWFPDVMQGCHEYIRTDAFPKVIKVDFTDLDRFRYAEAVNKDGLAYRITPYSCDKALEPLIAEMKNG